jgi:hypothetical protein
MMLRKREISRVVAAELVGERKLPGKVSGLREMMQDDAEFE